ncbi:S phase cyclin A-associated protein in the endoplasmic reticulum [Cyphomyrmex costatus]|uniref:S phase cyclin A-associated protein in the endoplasmic reticulum n=1 Tax=Cyphomyrmex costatus TaxID=456900 RepID=A0A151INN1_9HYME|nr:S phase cyclin A-associated protein in the endoplasmic reticulum [Cyphomyrmex costatus]
MADVRLLIQEEGRAARNLVAFNVPVGTNNVEKITKKPPSVPRQIQSSLTKRSMKPTTRVRSASTGRDKKSELQARYWAFLFGNLQRAVDGIYQTCEEDENISECKEVILVLENYTRDFHNLIEWFKVKWAYENSAPPSRRTPLAWEVRKTSPCRMWNSTIIPKSTSPLQRSSPTELVCKSPVDQIICENKPIVTDNKVHSAKEEFVHKLLKDSKNNVCKNCSSDIKEKCKNGADKTGNQATNKEKSISTKTSNKVLVKQTVQSKTNSFVDRRTLNDGVTYDSRNKMDVKNISKQTKDCLHSNIIKLVDSNLSAEKREQTYRSDKDVQLSSCPNCELVQKEYNGVDIKDSKTDGKSMDSKLSYNKNNGLGKNEINTKVKKDSNRKCESNVNAEKLSTKTAVVQSTSEKINQVDCQINKQAGDKSNTQNALSNNIDKNPVIISTDRPAYSTVSQTKRSKEQSSISSETPKFVRSKTCLSDKNLSASSKRRPGTSVIVRGRFQTPENKLSEQNTLKKDQNRDMNGSVEVLTKQTVSPKLKDESDGWQTVRNRCRRGSTHNLNMSTRFHKPSTALSLPALSIESPSEKLKKTSYTPDGNKQKKKCIVGKTGKNMNNEVEKVKGEYITSTIKSNLEDTLKKNTINLCDTNSTSVIAAIFKNDAELLEKRIQQFMTAQAERERIILEEERKTEEADSQRSQQLSDEEASLKRQILELESTEIDIDTETDETDGEMVLEIEDEPVVPLSVVTDDISLEDRYGNMLEGMSWAERVDTLAQLRALVARHPGRALELHQKLSSPSRKRSLPETLRRYQAKQACAQHKRQKLLMEKSQRLRELLNKVEDVKSAKNQLIEDKRVRMEMKLKRAEENRTQHLLEIVRKAHDEDSKLKEIAFINELEAQNKRHDFMALCQEQEERLQGIQEERQRRQEEKAAKEAAAEERRRALEAERQLRIQKMKQARREREERVGKMQLEREKERQELAREKARDREERLLALHAAQLANQEELQKKIAQKQQESARRHVENIEHIRQRAISNEVHLLSHLKGKTHLEAVRNAHDNREPSRDELQRFNIAQIRDVPVTVINNNNANNSKAAKEKQKALKRRCRKIKQRMSTRGQEWEDKHKSEANQNLSVESANKAKFRRNLKELDRLYNNHSKSAWSNIALATLERCLGEIIRAFSKSCPLDQDTFRYLNGFDTLTNLLNLGLNIQNVSHILPNKVITLLCRVYKAGVSGNTESIEDILLSNKILVILDLLLQRLETLTSLDDHAQTQDVSANSTGNGTVAASATQLLCSLIPEEPFEKTVLQTRVQDIAGSNRRNRRVGDQKPITYVLAAVQTGADRGAQKFYSTYKYAQTGVSFLGAEGTNLQWRLIASHLITRLSRDSLSDKTEVGSMPNTSGIHILSELFMVLGYFSLNNPDNQLVLQSAGAGPSVLQQLCTLPFPFYGDPRLIPYTLPALLAATHHNSEAMAILSCEMSYELLEQYRNSDEGKLNPLVRLLKDST